MKSSITFLTILSILFLASSCKKDSIRGEGSLVSKKRDLDAYNSVQSNGDIKLHIVYGGAAQTEVRGYANLVDITETNVVNGKLIVGYKKEYYNVRNSNIELFLVLPQLSGVSVNGSGDAWIDGFMNAVKLEASINGSSNISISNSSFHDASLDVNGSGDFRAAGLQTQNTDATIHGSGDVEISCSDNLKARIYGSGDVKYWGSPALNIAISGSGRVSKQ